MTEGLRNIGKWNKPLQAAQGVGNVLKWMRATGAEEPPRQREPHPEGQDGRERRVGHEHPHEHPDRAPRELPARTPQKMPG